VKLKTCSTGRYELNRTLVSHEEGKIEELVFQPLPNSPIKINCFWTLGRSE
jgi:hypothetical protein